MPLIQILIMPWNLPALNYSAYGDEMKVLNDLVLNAAERRAKELRKQRADRAAVRVSVGITILLILIVIFVSGCTYTGRNDPHIYSMPGTGWTGFQPLPTNFDRVCLARPRA